MMLKLFKNNLSFIVSIAVIIIISAVGYYLINLKRAPYPVADFKSFTYKWGFDTKLENSYTSADGSYHYLDNRDTLIDTHVKLRTNDIIFIHNKINELGFWNLPNVIGKPNSSGKSPLYELQFSYKEKTKKIIIYSNSDETPQLLDSAMQIVKLIQRTIDEAEGRYH